MASSPNPTTQDGIEEELEFQEVLISSLDPGADDYAERLAELEAKKSELESKLDALQNGSRPQTAQSQSHNHLGGMDGSYDPQRDSWWQATVNGHPGGQGSQNGNQLFVGPSISQLNQFNTMKRPLPQSLRLDSQHPSKRPTPEPSNAGTPTSSADSFELLEYPSNEVSERARRRQLQMEAAWRRQREDEQLARQLSQQQSQSRPFLPSSSSRQNVQTTLDYNGSYQRPPPPTRSDLQPMAPPPYGIASSSTFSKPSTPNHYPSQQRPPHIKSEPGLPRQQQLVQRPRIPEVVDLTNSDSDDDDEDITEIAPNGFTPSNRGQRPVYNNPYAGAPAVQPVQRSMMLPTQGPMPGAFPTTDSYGNQYVYNNANNVVPQCSSMMQQANPLLPSAFNGIRNLAGSLQNPLAELGNLIQGSMPALNPFNPDDDIIYAGSRPLQPARPAHAGYDDLDLYQSRYDAIQNHDPAKTQEEVNALLENIRPDEEMPAYLRVQTPESMTIKLHKYQELGLTWLQKCEDGSNKGGILADDMGLGKTIQMLGLIVTHKSEDPRCKTTLIVAPVALMRQWKQEIEQKIKPGRHALSVHVHHGQSKRKSFNDLRLYDIVLTTFGSLASELNKKEKFRLRQLANPGARPVESEKCALISDDAQWYRVVLDESQNIKNVNTKTARAACYLNAKYRFCMTGTPMMNNVDELYSLVRFLRIKPYSEWTKFRLDFTTPLKSTHEDTRAKAMRMLQTLCKAIMLRRTKKSTFEGAPILVLPERTTEINNPEFDGEEMAFYQALENRTQLQFNKYLRRGTVGSSYSAILVLLLRLRQACCHPHLIKDFGVSATAGLTSDDLIELAKQLDPQVVARIKETNGSFECPVCYDAVMNPAIFIPCGHDACSDCFARIVDPAVRNGEGDQASAKCPNCRGPIDQKRITNFESFRKVHMPELLSAEEQQELGKLQAEVQEDSETESDDSETESEDDSDDVDEKGNLAGFVVDDAAENSETESGAEEAGIEDGDGVAGPSTKAAKSQGKAKDKGKKSKKAKKGKGKEKEQEKKQKKTVTLAELKQLANRNVAARKAYLRKLNEDWTSSAKIDKTMETLKEIIDDPAGEKVLVFSQWTSLLDLLEVPIDKQKWDYCRYDGSMSAKLRGDAVDDFRDPRKNKRIMLVSLKAGNAGLNLNMASQVIILDPFWNPYIEEQAIDRAHRIGQAREVKVRRMLIQNTVEDRIIELQEKKRALISEALDENASQNIGRLGVQELAYLFGVTRNPTQRIQYVPRDAR